MPYVAKIGVYRKECQDVADKGYEGFVLAVTPGNQRGGA